MALTPEQERERLELIQKQNEAAKQLVTTYQKMAKTVGGLSDEEKGVLDIAKKLSKLSSELEKSAQRRLNKSSSLEEIQQSILELEQSSLKNSNIAAQLENAKQKAATNLANARATESRYNQRIAQELDNQQAILDEIEEIKKAEGGIDRRALADARERLRGSKGALDTLEKGLKRTIETKEQQRALHSQLEEGIKAHEEIVEQQQLELHLAKQVEKQKQKEALYDVVKDKFNTKFVKDWYDIIKSGNVFAAWLAFFKLALDAAFRFNAVSVDISKNFGYSTAESDRLTQSLVEVAAYSKNVNVTLQNASEAMNELNTATGLVSEYSADTLETQIMLTKQFGLQADEAAGIYKFSVLNNKSASDTNKAMVSAFVAARNSFKVGANFKQVMAEASKVSGQLAANLGYNPERITKAVVAMKAFGTTLEQTKSQGTALLNFESSLENELKAELLTGEQINLERARAAALAGDQVTLAEELANQGMTLEKFSGMNVLAQEAYAQSLGLTADQLSEQLQKQKQAEESGKTLAQITEEDALEAQKRQKIQDKFNQAMEKLQDLIGNLVAGPLAMFLDGLTTAITFIGILIKPIYLLADLAGYIGGLFAGWAEKLGPFGFLLKGIAGVAIVLAAYGAYAALAWIPVVGPILGAAAAVAVLAKGFSALAGAKKAGDMISPADGKTQVSTKEGGLFELSENDDLLAGPGLASKAEGKGISPSIDLTPMIAAINAVRASVDRLYDKDTSVNMDGKKVGSTLTQGSYKSA